MNLYLDIETIPGQGAEVIELFKADAEQEKAEAKAPANYKDEAKIAEFIAAKHAEIDAGIEERWRKTSFDGALGHVAVIGYAINDQAPVTIYRDDFGTLEAESHILSTFFAAITEASTRALAGGTRSATAPTFIGHNVLDFDLRFLFQRAVMLGIRPPACIPFDAKPWDKTVFDTMTAWAGTRNRVSQDKLCRAFGIAGKGAEIGEEIDGSMVWDFVKAGRIADVAKYCAGDVERVRAIHRRLTFQSVT